MPNTNQADPRKKFAPRLLPWILGGGMWLIYLGTLNHWVTLANLMPVARISGFLWQPEYTGPLSYLATLPFRLLSPAAVPLALNLFAAVCAALTLGLLARSVAILPHDRTSAQRQRERSDFSFLTFRWAWIPPTLAVAMLGWQSSFWAHATSHTGEMLGLLIFAVVIWLLLEYRLDERPGRLFWAAFIYGAGITENWAMLGFLPLFIVALVWIKKWEFFRFDFFGGVLLSGLAGLAFYLLLPIVGQFSSSAHPGFWEMLKPALQMDWMVIKAGTYSQYYKSLLLISLTTLMPVLLMAIRWSASFGDESHTGRMLAGQMFHFIYAAVFGLCLWIMFDPSFSPSQLLADLGIGTPALTFYYLAALALGYFAGYFLLVFRPEPKTAKRNTRIIPPLPASLSALTPVIRWGMITVAVALAVTLAGKNLPLIRSWNDDTLKRYAELTVHSLPVKSAILLGDSMGAGGNMPVRTLLVQSELARVGRAKDYLVVDTASLNWMPYLSFLHRQAPDKWPAMTDKKEMGGVNPIGLLGALNLLARSNTLCYLNPSFGYYFETFYQEPHGLTYELKKLPEATLLPPVVEAGLIAENQALWVPVTTGELARLQQAQTPDAPTGFAPVDWLVQQLHGHSPANPNAALAAELYSRGLNFWGVQLQRAGQFPQAADYFAAAKKANPDNIVAGVNLEFNHDFLQTGKPPVIDLSRVTSDHFGRFHDWNSLMNACGPFDEPAFCFQAGFNNLNNTFADQPMPLMRQALAEFHRVYQLVPDNLVARMRIAQIYLFNRLPEPASAVLREPLADLARFGLSVTNATELNVLASAVYFQNNDLARGVELLETEMARHPQNEMLFTSAAQAFFLRGLYTNALNVINHKLAQTPDDSKWLFGRGYAYLQMSNYDQAITAFTRTLAVATNDPTARFNRALAYLQSGRLDDARADYQTLQATYTNSFQLAYGLGEVAWRQRATNDAIVHYEHYLATAPTNAPGIKIVQERLAELRAGK